jgi:hypothetical protein
VQLTDSFTEFTAVHGRSFWEVFSAELHNGTYFRPLRRELIKIVYELSGGNFYLAFRGFQALQLLVLLLLVVRMLRVRSVADAAVLPLGLATVVGMHTFAGTVLEGLPINHFLTILICCAVAVCLSQAKPRPLIDIAAVAVLVAAMLTIESGLLVIVLFVAAYSVGYRGVSRRALMAMVACVGLYFVARFVLLGGSAPGLSERSAGFGFSTLDPDELVRRFGTNPLPFYVYNLMSAICCVLFAEPRGGVWVFTRGLVEGGLEPWQIVNVVTNVCTTWMIAQYVFSRFPQWRRGQFEDPDRFVVMFLMVLPANALFAAAYEKDVILSPAGLFYALAAYSVLRQRLLEFDAPAIGESRGAVSALVVVMAVGWSIRLVGIHHTLAHRSMAVRDEWAYYDDWERKQPIHVELSVEEEAIRKQLFDDAVSRAPYKEIALGPLDALFDPTQ